MTSHYERLDKKNTISLYSFVVAVAELNCFMVSERGFMDTIFPIKGGVLRFHYLYTDVAPINLVYTINGIPQHTYSASIPQHLTEPPEEIEETMPVTVAQQSALGIGTHIFAVNMTVESGESTCVKEIQLLELVTGVSLSLYKRFVGTGENFKALVNVGTGYPCTIESLVLDVFFIRC